MFCTMGRIGFSCLFFSRWRHVGQFLLWCSQVSMQILQKTCRHGLSIGPSSTHRQIQHTKSGSGGLLNFSTSKRDISERSYYTFTYWTFGRKLVLYILQNNFYKSLGTIFTNITILSSNYQKTKYPQCSNYRTMCIIYVIKDKAEFFRDNIRP